MYSLIGLGVGLAYLFSLVAILFPELFPMEFREHDGSVGTYFEGGGHYVVVRPPLRVPDAPNRGDQMRTMTQALAVELEQLILEAPEQWHLVVPNWPSDRE